MASLSEVDVLAWVAALRRARGGGDGRVEMCRIVLHAARRYYAATERVDRLIRVVDVVEWRASLHVREVAAHIEALEARLIMVRGACASRFDRAMRACRPEPSEAEVVALAQTAFDRRAVRFAFTEHTPRVRRPRRLRAAAGAVSVLSRAQSTGAMLTTGQLMWAGRRAAVAYRVRHGADPTRVVETGPDGGTRQVYGYPEADVDIVDEAIAAEVRGDPRTGLGPRRRRQLTEPPPAQAILRTPGLHAGVCAHGVPMTFWCPQCFRDLEREGT